MSTNNYNWLREKIRSDLLCTVQMDMTDGRIPFNIQMVSTTAYLEALVNGMYAAGHINKVEIVNLDSTIDELGRVLKCEWEQPSGHTEVLS